MDGDSGRFIADCVNEKVLRDLEKNAMDNNVIVEEEAVDARSCF